jgi:hypothetical protein
MAVFTKFHTLLQFQQVNTFTLYLSDVHFNIIPIYVQVSCRLFCFGFIRKWKALLTPTNSSSVI